MPSMEPFGLLQKWSDLQHRDFCLNTFVFFRLEIWANTGK